MKDLRSAAEGPWDAIVVGGGIGGLAAAWEFLRAGLRPLVLEARGYAGGQIASMRVGGAMVDIGAESFAPRGEAVSSMVEELGLEIVEPGGGTPSLFLPPPGGDGGWASHPFAPCALMGIPSDPDLPGVRAIIGDEGTARALEDTRLDPRVGADAPDLASLVEARMGRAVLERMVRPIVSGIYSADPSRLDAERVVPGLRAGLARHGSLAAAVGALLAGSGARRGDLGVRGGMSSLVSSLVGAIEKGGGAVLTRTGARSLSQRGRVRLVEAGPCARASIPSAEPVPAGPPLLLETTRLLIASSPASARRLLSPWARGLSELQLPKGAPIVRCFLALDSPALDEGPAGPGVLVAPDAGCPVGAKALSQLDLKWPWVGGELEAAHGPHAHMLRLSYGRPGEEDRTPGLDDVLQDAQLLTGADLDPAQVLDLRVVHWNGTLAQATPDLRGGIDALREEVEGAGGIALSGAWAAGSGVAGVVSDARARARALL